MRVRQTGERYRRAGFQLIELMVVLVIFGIIIAVAVPSLTRRTTYHRIEGSARELSVRMQTARQKAVSRRVPYRMILNTPSGAYQFERQMDDSTWVQDPAEIYTFEASAETWAQARSSSTRAVRYARAMSRPRSALSTAARTRRPSAWS